MGRHKISVKLISISVKVPANLRKLVYEKIMGSSIYLSESDFYRSAIIEKIQREFPELVNEIKQGIEVKG